jgi:hypothetical protein
MSIAHKGASSMLHRLIWLPPIAQAPLIHLYDETNKDSPKHKYTVSRHTNMIYKGNGI